MVRVRQRVTVAAVQRRWFESYVFALHDVIEEKLASLDEGAVFALSHEFGQSFEVASWGRAVETRIASVEEDGTTAKVSLRSADHPVFFELAMTGPDLDVDVVADLGQWWEQVDGWDRQNAPISLHLRHRRADGGVELRFAESIQDRWAVDVSVAIRGHGWLRPLVALVVLTFGRGAIRRTGVESGEQWDRWVADATSTDPRSAAERLIGTLTEEGP